MEKEIAKESSLALDGRKRLTVCGVEDILAFDETNLLLQTVQGELNVDGAGLRMLGLSLEERNVTVEGKIDALFYIDRKEKQKKGLFGRKD